MEYEVKTEATEATLAPETALTPAAPEAAPQRRIVPVVFAANRNYAPCLYVSVFTLLAHASADNEYRICVIHSEMDAGTRELFCRTLTGPNVSVTFLDVADRVRGYVMRSGAHISAETYYRFLIPELLGQYPRVIYLDCDMVFCRDVSALLDVDMGDCAIAAGYALGVMANAYREKGGDTDTYLRDVLGIDDPRDYSQAGVLVLDTERFRRAIPMEKLMEYAADTRFRLYDQDIISMVFAGKTKRLDVRWNLPFDHCGTRLEELKNYLPADLYDEYMEARDDPWIVHYAGGVKPWSWPGQDYGSLFWDAARQTPYYDTLRLAMEERMRGEEENPVLKAYRTGRDAILAQEAWLARLEQGRDWLEGQCRSRDDRIRELEEQIARREKRPLFPWKR